MDFYYGLAQTIGIHTLLGLSAYVILLTGQMSMAQAAFYAIGAYSAGMLTTLFGWHILPALFAGAAVGGLAAGAVGFPALRVKGLMLVIATLVFGEGIRLFFFNFDYQIAKDNIMIGPNGPDGFRQIRYFPENGWTAVDVMMLVWLFVVLVMALIWWFDRSRYGSVLRAVGDDELAAQSVGINLTAMKVSAMTIGGAIAGFAGGLYAHYTTHIEHLAFGVVQSVFAVAYAVIGGMGSVFGTLVAVIFVQGFLVEGLRFLGDWRNLLFGALIIVAMVFMPNGLLNANMLSRIKRIFAGRRGNA
ncbi:MAG: branched-chain amino acid ABC transporter permease [Proteobacteria bacterium]|nr:branched-chain amino acid ABC transporter permease [Pseudomonadota bacterium]MDA0983646.1 branched-chain amino acid ABC transporter permease [Pseudomonadota bacterium]